MLPQHIVVPTDGSKVIIAPFNPNLRTKLSAPLGAVAITDTPADQLLIGDSVAYIIDNGGTPEFKLETINDAGTLFRGRRYYELATETVDEFIYVFRQATLEFDGTVPDDTKPNEMQIDGNDNETKDGSVPRVHSGGLSWGLRSRVTGGSATTSPPRFGDGGRNGCRFA